MRLHNADSDILTRPIIETNDFRAGRYMSTCSWW